jgi:hypothetical protein
MRRSRLRRSTAGKKLRMKKIQKWEAQNLADMLHHLDFNLAGGNPVLRKNLQKKLVNSGWLIDPPYKHGGKYVVVSAKEYLSRYGHIPRVAYA